jgi:hypothetical protein
LPLLPVLDEAPAVLTQHGPLREDDAVAKGQKKSNREIRKPKAEKPKPAVAASSFSSSGSKKK